MRIKKKGTSGNAKNFITRTQAVKKLQISLADFRRLCIFKGIYPREPRNKKKANKGSTAPVTFYYAKDIQYLMHEPVLMKFREHKTFAKKLQRALGRGEISDAEKLDSNRPQYKLDHVIKERYPTFLDALRDLDDPLNMLFLFANMPATDKVSTRIIKTAETLTNQWLAYVAKERCLKKVFVSIKGVYYEANVKGQEIRWLVPFKFPTLIPTDIDFRIMLTFLEFYSNLLKFVLFKLYKDSNLVYPPLINKEVLKSVGGLTSYILNEDALPQKVNDEQGQLLSKKELSKALKADKQSNDEEIEDIEEEKVELDEFSTEKGDSLIQPSKYLSPTSQLFEGFVFFVSREVPLDILEFCILSCGGKIISEVAINELKYNDSESYKKLDLSKITHEIIDRPKFEKVGGRTYIQPQWVFDSINKKELISVNKYVPGEILPPHLSPWGDSGNYNPENAGEGEQGEEEIEEEEEEEEVEEEEEDEEDDEEIDEDLLNQKELEKEASGSYEPIKTKKRKVEEDDEKELKKIMMTNKQRKLYNKMQYGIEKKKERKELLDKKRKKLQKTKNELNNL